MMNWFVAGHKIDPDHWYFKAAEYIAGTEIAVGFVSSNSITQGEQVGVLWQELYRRGIKIRFGHRTFAWQSEARGKAHVHVVIIGFGLEPAAVKRIHDYETDPKHAQVAVVKNISPYLTEGNDTVILNRSRPICAVPRIGIGNKPIDGGNFLFYPEQMAEFVKAEPASKRWTGFGLPFRAKVLRASTTTSTAAR